MLKKTALHDLHVQLGAKMGEFAGYDMPLYYGEGVIKEHEWVRSSCGLFDVSHMGQASITGEGSLALVQKLTPSAFARLEENRTKYTVLLNEQGGIIDDLMITRTGDEEFHMVLNAGCKDKDLKWIESHVSGDVKLKYYDDWALLALQGQKAEEVLRDVLDIELKDMPYMSLWYQDYEMFISRLGYTGEDGFEIAVSNEDAPALAEKLLAHDAVKPIGLAARDSLRLEMGYALYGHDINAETSPVDANMTWLISKSAEGYFGYERVHKDLSEGVDRKLVGFKLIDRGVAREGAEIRDENDNVIGELTSGGHSPTMKASIAMGYVDTAFTKSGTKVFINVRGKNLEAAVSALPFIPAKTKSMKKNAA